MALSSTFTGPGVSASEAVSGQFNLSISGCDPDAPPRIDLERTLDSGTTWKLVRSYRGNVEATDTEPGTGVSYRLNCRQMPQTDPIAYVLGNG